MEPSPSASRGNSTDSQPSLAPGRATRAGYNRFLLLVAGLGGLLCGVDIGITGGASIIGYNATILIHAGLDDLQAHRGYAILTAINFLMTIGGVLLVDRKGRKFLLSFGTAGIIVSLVWVALLFYRTEQGRIDCHQAVQAMVTPDRQLKLAFNPESAARLLAGQSTATQALLKAL